MAKFTYDSFVGYRLLVMGIRLHDEGTVIKVRYTHDGLVIFTTETGEHTFYYKGMKPAVMLADGSCKFPGDFPRKGYVRPKKTRRWHQMTREDAPEWLGHKLMLGNSEPVSEGRVRTCSTEGDRIFFTTRDGHEHSFDRYSQVTYKDNTIFKGEHVNATLEPLMTIKSKIDWAIGAVIDLAIFALVVWGLRLLGSSIVHAFASTR